MKILLAGLGDKSETYAVILQAAFDYQSIDCELIEEPGISAEQVQDLLPKDFYGASVGGELTQSLFAACTVHEGDALSLGGVNLLTVTDDGIAGDHVGSLAFELGTSEMKMWPASRCRAVVVGDGQEAAVAVHSLSHVPTGEIVVSAASPEGRPGWFSEVDPSVNLSFEEWAGQELAASIAAADVVVNTTQIALAELPFSIRELPMRCEMICTETGAGASEIVAEVHGAHRRAMDGAEIDIAAAMLSFGRWTHIQPPPYNVAREAHREWRARVRESS